MSGYQFEYGYIGRWFNDNFIWATSGPDLYPPIRKLVFTPTDGPNGPPIDDPMLVPGDYIIAIAEDGSRFILFFKFSVDDGFIAQIYGSSSHYFFTDSARTGGVLVEGEHSYLLCFLPGTQITTPSGLSAVEDLNIGDFVLTADGQTVPVKWIGRQSVRTMFGPPEERRPVAIAPGALGENLPARELRLTSDHALMIGGLLVQAGALVNGTTIRRLSTGELGEKYIVYHIETQVHSLILAEGVPAETFLDNVTRRRFDNYSEYETLYGDLSATIAEMEAPRVKSARQLPKALKERFSPLAATGHATAKVA